MPGPQRDQIRLTPQEQLELLREGRTVQVGTINRDGTPHLVPLFYVLDDQERITFWTYPKSQKVVNLRRDPRITCLVEKGARTEEVRFVQIKGRAIVHDDRAMVERVGTALHERYIGPMDDAARESQRQRGAKRVVVVVEPERVVTWDHRKLYLDRQVD